MALRIEEDPLQLLDVRQDEVDQGRSGLGSDVAPQRGDGRLRARDEPGDDGRIGLERGGSTTGRRTDLTLVGDRRDEVVAFQDGLQRVPDQRIAPPHDFQEACTAGRGHQALGDVDEEPPAGLVHPRESGQLPHGDPQGLHGVGHHLVMTDGDEDVVPSVVGHRNGEQCGDRPALDDMELVIGQAPFDVLGASEVRFYAPSQPGEPDHLRIRQRRLILPRHVDRLFPGPTGGRGTGRELLRVDRLGDDLAVSHPVNVCVHPSRDQGLAEAEDGLHHGDLPVGRDRVGGEEDAGRLREHHLLHDHGHAHLAVVETVLQPVGHSPLGEE